MQKNSYDLVIISICVSIICTPLYLVRFSLFGLPANLFLIISLVLLFVFLTNFSLRTMICFAKKNPLFLFCALLILVGGLFSFWSKEYFFYTRSFSIFLQWLLLPMMLGVFTAIHLFKNTERDYVDILLLALFVSTSLVSVIALSYAIMGFFTYDHRLRAFYESPNQLAMYILPGIFIGYYFAVKSWKNTRRKMAVVYCFLTISTIASLLLTRSSGAIIATAISLPVVFFFSKSGVFRYATRICLLFVFAFFLAISLFGATRMTALSHVPERSSLASRFMIWQSAMEMIKNNPIYGIGPGNFQAEYLAYQKYFPPYLEWAVPQPHNLYLAFWLQTGLLGITGFILLIFSILKYLADSLKQKNALLTWALLGIFVSLLIHGLVDTPYWKNDLAFFFWIIVAIIISYSREKKALS